MVIMPKKRECAVIIALGNAAARVSSYPNNEDLNGLKSRGWLQLGDRA